MEIIEPIEMLLVDVHNNDMDEDFMDDHDQVFDLTPKKALHGLRNGRPQCKPRWMLYVGIRRGP